MLLDLIKKRSMDSFFTSKISLQRSNQKDLFCDTLVEMVLNLVKEVKYFLGRKLELRHHLRV